MIRIIFIILALPEGLLASYPEFFGTSPFTQAIGNQANLNVDDPSNNYYIPALSAYAKTINIAASMGLVDTKFEKIKNVVIKNPSTSDTSERGDVSTNYRNSRHGTFNIVLPFDGSTSAIGISLFSPFGNVIEADSGSSNLPEYVMYRTRYKRILAHINYARSLGERLSLSLGTHLGFQSTSKAYTQTSLNGAKYGSSSQIYSQVSPTLGGVVSILTNFKRQHFYFTYQQEMKSHIKAKVSGEINDPTGLLFSITLESMIYYDPHIFRLGWVKRLRRLSGFFSLEHQLWKHYKPPTISIERNSGIILPSNNHENLRMGNITVPKLGLHYSISNTLAFMTGFSFRPTPFKGDFAKSGNSLDSDSTIYSMGLELKTRFLDRPTQWGLSVQYHSLKSHDVVKSPLQENGSPGDKIGAPGYKIGGQVLTGTLGLRIGL